MTPTALEEILTAIHVHRQDLIRCGADGLLNRPPPDEATDLTAQAIRQMPARMREIMMAASSYLHEISEAQHHVNGLARDIRFLMLGALLATREYEGR